MKISDKQKKKKSKESNVIDKMDKEEESGYLQANKEQEIHLHSDLKDKIGMQSEALDFSDIFGQMGKTNNDDQDVQTDGINTTKVMK